MSLPFLARPLFNPDLFWHLSAGKFIIENHSVPRADFLSWTMRGAAWVDFEWLTQVFYYLTHLAAGFPGLYFLKISVLLLNLGLLGRLISRSGADRAHLVWLLPLCAAAMLPAADLRPENFSAAFFSATLLFLESERGTQVFSFRKAAGFFVLYMFWANIHGGFFYGLFLAGIYSAGSFLKERIEKKPSGFRPLLAYSLAAFFATLINPYGPGVYSVIFKHYGQAELLKNYICEWQTFNPAFRSLWPFTALMLLAAGAFIFRFFREKEKDFPRLLLLLAFLWLSLAHMRNLNYSAMVFSFLLAVALPRKIRPASSPALAAILVLPLLAFHLKAAGPAYYRNLSFSRFSNSSEGLSAFLRKNSKELGWLRMSNPWEWGGWLGWKLHPEYGIFVDGRYIFHDFLGELSDSSEYLDSWAETEKKNRFELVIMEPGGKELKFKDPARAAATLDERRVFLPGGKWALVYFDSRIFAAVRRDSVSPEWLRENEYLYLRPWGYENILPPPPNAPVDMRKAGAELSRYYSSRGKDFYDPQAGAVRDWHKSSKFIDTSHK